MMFARVHDTGTNAGICLNKVVNPSSSNSKGLGIGSTATADLDLKGMIDRERCCSSVVDAMTGSVTTRVDIKPEKHRHRA